MLPRTCRWALLMVAAASVLAQPGFGQGRGAAPPAGAPAGGTTPGTPTAPGTTTPPTSNIPNLPGNNNPNSNTTQPMGIPRPIPISGRVMMEDGTAPDQPVTIERVCGGSTHAEGYTDSKGFFFIQLGDRNNGVLQDASETSGGFGSMNPNRGMGTGMGTGTGTRMGGAMGAGGMDSDMRYTNCELQAKLPGYRSQTVSLVNRRSMDNPDIGTILLHRLDAGGGGATISASDLNIPKDAKKAFEKGQESAKKGKLEDALKNYSKAVELYRSYAGAWYELGKLQAGGGDLYTARGSFGEALKADPKFVPAYVAMADLDIQAKKWKEVAEITDRASKLDVFDYPQVYFFNAVANYNLKNVDAAEKSVRQAERLDTRHAYPQVHFLLANIMAIHHDFSGAAEQFRTYLKLAPDAEDSATARKQLAQVEKITASAQEPKQDQ